jgi:hypothetical protein
MATNTILTPTMITRAALAILHQKLNFVGNINRQYDEQFAKSGAKIGSTLNIRLPNQYRVRTGAALSTGADLDTVETNTSLTVNKQAGVDVEFSSSELTMNLQDFSQRILEPAMAQLAAHIEADALTMYRDVNNVIDNDTAAISMLNVLQGRQRLNELLAPMDRRIALLQPFHTTKLVDALKGLFHDSTAVKEQYREGSMGRTGGFEFYENTLLTNHTTGTAAKTTGYVCNTSSGITSGTAAVTVSGGTTTFLVGDVITIADVFRVHPESKASTAELQQFVVTANSGTSATSLALSPTPITSGPRQNVTLVSAGASKAIVKVGAGANETMNSSMVFHPDAFTFATADLVMPGGVDFAAREVMDGISMRVVRQYNISTDQFPCRLDVLYGYRTIRPQLAARIHADG